MLHLCRKQYESAHIYQPVELHFHSSLEKQGPERLRLLLIKRTCKWSPQSESALTKLEIATTGCPAWTRSRRSPFQSRITPPNTRQQETRSGAISSASALSKGHHANGLPLKQSALLRKPQTFFNSAIKPVLLM